MKKLLKSFLSVSVFFWSALCAFADTQNVSAQMEASYKSRFYPGVVRYAEEILRTEKDSLAAFRASVYEGESLFRMGRVEDARAILQKYTFPADAANAEVLSLHVARFYWLGRALSEQQKLAEAQNCFFASASIFADVKTLDQNRAASSADYYALSMLFGARCYFDQRDYKGAVPLFEYVLSNGALFALSDYEDSAVKLAQSYNESLVSAHYAKCVQVVSQLENAQFSEQTTYNLLLLKGEAQEQLKQYKAAYETYCRVIENAPSALAAQAMQKAYAVSSAHKADVGSEPGSVIAQAEGRLSEFPDLLSEFWTRLAVDAFYAGDYKKSRTYFDEAEKNASLVQTQIAAVYRAEIAYADAADKNAGSAQAIQILEAVKTKNETIILCLARYNGYLKNWKDCEKYAASCLNSENAESAKNAVFWVALSKYERGDIQGAVTSVENYNRVLNGVPVNSFKSRQVPMKITDASILNLYAKALAKTGKYHDADVIFYSLGEKNQLDNDGRLDYSRTLLIAGHYVSTKEQAAKANGDEALYLAALASFNQRKWQEAENGFSKVLSSKTLSEDYVAYAEFYLGYAQYQNGEYAKAVVSLNRFIEDYPMHTFNWSAYMTAARAAAFSKNTSAAIAFSQLAVRTARNEKDKQEATLLLAGIYADAQKYDEALSLLSPNIARRTEFGYESKYRSAEILVQKGRLSEADAYFAELAALNDKDAELISEESAYRRAELAYSNEQYKKAAGLFEEYSRKWASGRFFYAALYFSADSLAKTGDKTRAQLRYLQIVDAHAETSYKYGAEKNLVTLYQELGEYQNALAMANKLIDEYGSQALNDGMAEKVRELKKLGAGSPLKAADEILQAERELAKQKKDPAQSADAFKNALFLAGAYRSNGENKKSAQMYLEAITYARQSGNEDGAARCFYGAVEAFDAAKLYADAKATFTEMKKLYPNNSYTKDGEKIAGDL